MASDDQWKGLQALPLDNSSTPNGKYSVASTGEGNLTGDGPEIKYSVWFQTPPIGPTTIQRVHSLQLVTESHDQGFCDAPLAGNWTWFELAILENERSTSPRIKDGIELSWESHNNRFCTTEYGWKAGKIFPTDHDMFRLLEDGNVIAVRLCARFGGWEMWARLGYLVIEIGAEVERQPLEYGQIAFNAQAVQQAFHDVNSSTQPDHMQLAGLPHMLFRAQMVSSADDRPLCVLALDGGGVRGLAALMLLDAVMKKAAPGKKPCEVFDMIGGTSTGGFIAIMLGRFKMTIDECIAKYKKFMTTVFPESSKLGELVKAGKLAKEGYMYNSKPLEDIIQGLVKEKFPKASKPEDVLLLDENATNDSCKVFIMATKAVGSNNGPPVLLRSYKNPIEKSELPTIKLWEAARATSAAPTYFPPMKVGDVTFWDGGLQANNPLGWLWNEVLTVYGPARATNCFLSIGTGIPAASDLPLPWMANVKAFPLALSAITTNSEIINILFRSLINAFAPLAMAKKYWRFNVGDGLPDWVQEDGVWKWRMLPVNKRVEGPLGDLDDVAMMQQTMDMAGKYLKAPGADRMVADCADALTRKLNMNT